ncbi:MAG: zf-HC2 domain-containing protein [Thermoguttaceae bacterium]
MKNQPNDELLSAYLDGELNDAERAEIERRLATDPAARRLLEQLRSVSRAVQSLPREPLGESLTRQVIEEAERRREESDRPVPSSRSWSERFFNRRVIAWASLTLMVGAAIAIHERWQNGGLVGGGKSIKEVARAGDSALSDQKPSALKPQRTGDYRPPTMQAAPAEKPVAEVVRSESAVRLKSAVSSEKRRSDLAESNVGAMKKGDAPRSGGENVPAKAADALRDNVLVIRCDVSSEAARSQAFDKLLVRNGIVSVQRQAGQRIQSLGRSLAEAESTKADSFGRRDEDAEGEEIVEVEATPSQIEATLAGLESRPDAFPFVVVGPVEATKAKQQAYGASEPSSKPVQSPQSSFGYAAAPSRESQRLENQRQLQLNFQNQRQPVPSSLQQRAPFVLRVVDGGMAHQAVKRQVQQPAMSAPMPTGAPVPGK